MLDSIIPAYLYTQYNEDKHLQSLVDAYNEQVQTYYEWLRDSRLPIFAGGYNSGEQLKWVVKGIYGEDPPILKAVKRPGRGPLNTIEYNIIPYNTYQQLYGSDIVVASDDLFKRVMTWNFYRGDGSNFSISWLKRRIMRFLNGPNGVDPGVKQQWPVSVKMKNSVLEIVIDTTGRGIRYPSASGRDTFDYCSLFKSAMEGGILNIPYYFTATVTIKE